MTLKNYFIKRMILDLKSLSRIIFLLYEIYDFIRFSLLKISSHVMTL